MLEMLTFNIFISHAENGMEYTLRKFTDDTKLWRGMTDKLEVRADTERHFNRLEKWTDGDFLKFSSQVQTPVLEKDQPHAAGTLRIDWLESCLAKQDLGVLVDNKLNKNQQHAFEQ